MKRLLLVFIFMLPLQASWAATSAYAHRGEGEENHHSAVHKQHPDKDSSDTNPDKLHHHCSFSHLGGVAITGSFQLTFSPIGSFVSPHQLLHLPAPVPQRPERPNWRVLA
jgi:hypothetical protein